MSSIDIRRFVNINILPHISQNVNSTRDTTVLFSNEIANESFDKTFNSLEEVKKDNDIKNLVNTVKYAEIYFNNNGNKLRIIKSTLDSLKNNINKLEDKYIVVAFTEGTYSNLVNIAKQLESNYGVKQKIILSRTNSTTIFEKLNNLVVKYSNEIGAEMTVAAYLSNIDVYGINTVQDYAFTKENITPEEQNDDLLESILQTANVDMMLAGTVRNLGGNLTNEYSLVNQFCLIVLHQTVTERVLNLLTQKIKGNDGLTALHSVISQELGKYVTSGYLSTDKIWKDKDLTITYNNQSYTIIKQGTSLSLGYKIAILPLTSLTDEDIANKKTPPIYIILSESYGIRMVEISGEVI